MLLTKASKPNNLEAEKGILGAILIDDKAIKKIDLTGEEFYTGTHKKIFSAMKELDQKGEPIDIVTVMDVLKRMGELDNTGGGDYLTELAMDIPTSANIAMHAKIVKEHYAKRQLMGSCIRTVNSVHEESIAELLAGLRGDMSALVMGQSASKILNTKDVAKEVLESIEARVNNKGNLSGVTTGFYDLDEATDGLQPGDLNIIAGRPGMGKSAFAMNIAENAAESGEPVGVLSLEMSVRQLGVRTLSGLSGLELWKLRKGLLHPSEWTPLHEAVARMAELPIFYTFSARRDSQIEQVVTEMVERKGVRLLIVDYLQLIRGSDGKRREQEVAEISRMLKGIASDFKIPVIALSQLNRLSEAERRRPIMSDLRESGAIEQDADVILFLYRENPTETAGITEVIIGKGRQLGRGTITLYWDGQKTKFTNLTTAEAVAY